MRDSCPAPPKENVDTAKARVTAALASLGDLSRVEDSVRDKFASGAELLSEIPVYLLELGGKRMRPVLALLSAKLFGMNSASTELIDAAAAIELIHMATLMHDDIIDHSDLRRSAPSPLARYGVGNTLLAGDFLLVRAFSLCARLDSHIIAESERECIELTEGEILETPLHQEDHTLESALVIARKKTASLFRLAAHCGAYLAGAKDAVEQMSDFGQNLGIAFQILDDILDVASEANLHGKQTGIDIKERKPSVVNLLWLESGSPLAQSLRHLPGSDESLFVEAALKEIRAGPVVARARDLAAGYIAEAKEALQRAAALSPRPSPEAECALQAILDYTLERAE